MGEFKGENGPRTKQEVIMRIIIGRGKHRQVYELPHGTQLHRAMKNGEEGEVRDLVDNICHILGIG